MFCLVEEILQEIVEFLFNFIMSLAPPGVIYLTCPYFCVLVGRVYVSPLPNMAGHYWLSGRVPLGIYSLAERLAKEYFVHDRGCIQDRCDRIHLILLRPATEKPCISQLTVLVTRNPFSVFPNKNMLSQLAATTSVPLYADRCLVKTHALFVYSLFNYMSGTSVNNVFFIGNNGHYELTEPYFFRQ